MEGQGEGGGRPAKILSGPRVSELQIENSGGLSSGGGRGELRSGGT